MRTTTNQAAFCIAILASLEACTSADSSYGESDVLGNGLSQESDPALGTESDSCHGEPCMVGDSPDGRVVYARNRDLEASRAENPGRDSPPLLVPSEEMLSPVPLPFFNTNCPASPYRPTASLRVLTVALGTPTLPPFSMTEMRNVMQRSRNAFFETTHQKINLNLDANGDGQHDAFQATVNVAALPVYILDATAPVVAALQALGIEAGNLVPDVDYDIVVWLIRRDQNQTSWGQYYDGSINPPVTVSAWVNWSGASIADAQHLIDHEIGHDLSMAHASSNPSPGCTWWEYGDSSCVMGAPSGQCAQPPGHSVINAPHLDFLGALENGTVLNPGPGTLDANIWALGLPPELGHPQIVYVPADPPECSLFVNRIAMSYRAGVSPDSFCAAQGESGRVQLHLTSAPPSGQTGLQTMLLHQLSPGQTVTTHGVTVSFVSSGCENGCNGCEPLARLQVSN